MEVDDKMRRLRRIKVELHSLYKQYKGQMIDRDTYFTKLIPLVKERNTLSDQLKQELA